MIASFSVPSFARARFALLVIDSGVRLFLLEPSFFVLFFVFLGWVVAKLRWPLSFCWIWLVGGDLLLIAIC